MERRNLLMALGGAAAPLLIRSTAAHAQLATEPADTRSYITQTLQVGTVAKVTSQLALQQSSNPFVRRFAKLEIAEQNAVAVSLTDIFNPPPPGLTSDQQAAIAALQPLTGGAFDAAYVAAQILGHRQLFTLQRDFLAEDTDPTDNLVHVALIATAAIETHLAVLLGLVPLAQ